MWSIEEDIMVSIIDANKDPICIMRQSIMDDDNTRLKNARLIVKAVNEYDDNQTKIKNLVEEYGKISTLCNKYMHKSLLVDELVEALKDISEGNIPILPPLDDVLEFRTQMWHYSQERAKQALSKAESES